MVLYFVSGVAVKNKIYLPDLIANVPPNHAIGIYAKVKSMILNHIGEGSKITPAIPPRKKKKPTIKAMRILRVAEIRAAIKAPTKVPRACASQGIIKCLDSIRCIAAFIPCVVVKSAPSGRGMRLGLSDMMPILTPPPMMRPATTPKMFLNTGFMTVKV